MTTSATAAWLAATRARADQPPAAPREALWLGDRLDDRLGDHAGAAQARIGSLEPALAQRICDAGLPLRRVAQGWAVQMVSGAQRADGADGADAALAAIAGWLREAKLGNGWRDELLAVTDDAGRRHASIERAVVRPLGIATHAVHLLGIAEDGGMWVQQRAFDKASDPGLWDTTMGGLQAAGESVAETLARETWEEAGLELADLGRLAQVARCRVRRPLSHGYMLEHIECFDAVLPAGAVPANQDGEVERFECWPIGLLTERLRAGVFTLEAAVALGAWLERRGAL